MIDQRVYLGYHSEFWGVQERGYDACVASSQGQAVSRLVQRILW